MANFHHSRALASLLCFFVAWTLPAAAQDAFRLHITSGDTKVALGLEDLDALPQTEFMTSTLWTDGEIKFSGVSLRALLEAVEAEGEVIEMVALNDYMVTMPFSELEDDAPIVATRMDGETMSVRDKGPYWVVFPYDSHWKYRTETKYALSIWQLNRLKVAD